MNIHSNHEQFQTHLTLTTPLVPRGTALFTETTKPRRGKRIAFNGPVGHTVAFAMIDGEYKTIDATDIPSIKTEVFLGKFIDPHNVGYATDVKLIAGRSLDVCQLQDNYTVLPACGNPVIKAASIDCVKCFETYTAMVEVRDNKTLSYGMSDRPLQIFGTAHPQCNSCDDCDVEAKCKPIINEVVDSLNGTRDISLNGEPYPDYKADEYMQSKNWKAVVGHSNWFTYCIAPDPGTECKDCSTVDLIEEATINGDTVTFVNNADPSAPTKTLTAQLWGIADQIEAAYEEKIGKHAAFAFVTEGVTKCCPMQLHVVTCDADFAIPGLTACNIDADVSYVPKNLFADCTTPAATAVIPDCWFAVIAYPEKPDCKDCDIQEAPMYPGIEIDISFLKDSVSSYSPILSKKTLVEGTTPQNYGLEVRWLENKYPAYNLINKVYTTNERIEPYGNLSKNSRWANLVTADCEKLYCSFVFSNKKNIVNQLNGSYDTKVEFKTAIHVAQDNTSAKSSILGFLNAIVARSEGSCSSLNDFSCP